MRRLPSCSALASLYLSRSTAQDFDASLFAQTKRVVRELVRAHEIVPRAATVVEPVPAVGHGGYLLRTFGVAYDVDLSCRLVMGRADLIIGTTLFEIKTSTERDGVQISWILQLLMYAAMAWTKGGLEIDEIAVYNPLQGFIWRAPIGRYGREAGQALLIYASKKMSARVDKVTREL
jgi:hypothetical protein